MGLVRQLRYYYPWVFLAILVLYFALAQDPFFNGRNWVVIIRSVSTTGLYALGNSFVFLGGGVDLSVIAIGTTVAMVDGQLFLRGWSPELALFIAFLTAAGLGLINGLLVTKVRIAPFIATLASASIFNSISERVSGGGSIYQLGEQAQPPDMFFAALGRGVLGPIPVQVFIFLGVALGSFLLLAYTVYGRHLYAAGANPRAARLSGVNVDRVLIGTYVLSGLFCGMAGLIRASDLGIVYRAGGTIIAQGGPTLLASIAAVLIGGTSLSGGIGSIQGTIAGAMIIGVLLNGLTLFGAANWTKLLANGVVVIVAVSIGVMMSSGLPFQMSSLRQLGPLMRKRLSGLMRRPERT